ncbi:hypothetical protein Poly21_53690 [Allorhodopirellula heiligendammensis]|uniref:Uncharacterized protein n=1 Tax=Allorhodopirellula heiligendammensis TaxID=2714739 RepID=A0A5C6BH84_9BACT|nr:hypothetical protein Poly21_53690 [Allorhodopirellula heiligendammensis]
MESKWKVFRRRSGRRYPEWVVTGAEPTLTATAGFLGEVFWATRCPLEHPPKSAHDVAPDMGIQAHTCEDRPQVRGDRTDLVTAELTSRPVELLPAFLMSHFWPN